MEIKHIKNIFVIALIGSAIYFLPNYAGVAQKIGVKGASSERAQEVSSKIGSDINTQADVIKKQILNVKISDIINSVSNLSKVSQDIKNGEKYLREQVENVIKSKNK